MYRPAFIPKLRLNYDKTWAKLLSLLRDPRPIQPAPTPAHLVDALAPQKTVKLPQLRGNLAHTLKEIVRIMMAEWKKASTAINLAIFTTRTSIAKAGNNRDPKTGYRHIMALIEYGFLRGKVQVKGGLQLLLEPALFVFDAAPNTAAAALAPSYAPAPAPAAESPAQGLAGLLATAQNLKGTMWKTS
ncbi:hypothetical protein [Hymenobacter cheonanensis]|uniref:hypothetical protein n=1 Tax=Hymenobacter sp. CA2-7 TaxID=3063993 RepID=UPI0027125023|nr:hypothetical protein [Hymenobacter sp. CA2-7]MDO7885330.1 hypothetical protein [Hymenobacter sp. CA2-7]